MEGGERTLPGKRLGNRAQTGEVHNEVSSRCGPSRKRLILECRRRNQQSVIGPDIRYIEAEETYDGPLIHHLDNHNVSGTARRVGPLVCYLALSVEVQSW